MQLSPDKFNNLLDNLGQDVLWQQAYDCPCADPSSGAAKYGCPVCHQTGIVWKAAVSARTALAGQKVQRAWANFGMWENGDVVLTIPSDSLLYDVHEFDRVEFIDSSTPFSIKLTRGSGDTLDFTAATIERVFWLDPATQSQIVEGGIPTVDANGVMTWIAGEPPTGVQYSITGRKRPEYFCFGDFPQDRAHQSGSALPRRVVLRSYNLFRKGT